TGTLRETSPMSSSLLVPRRRRAPLPLSRTRLVSSNCPSSAARLPSGRLRLPKGYLQQHSPRRSSLSPVQDLEVLLPPPLVCQWHSSRRLPKSKTIDLSHSRP